MVNLKFICFFDDGNKVEFKTLITIHCDTSVYTTYMRLERLLNTVSQHELLFFSHMCNQLLWMFFFFSFFAAFKSAASRIHPEDLTIRNACACYNLCIGGVLSEQVEQTRHYRGNMENDSLQQLECWNQNGHNKDGVLTLLARIWFQTNTARC